MTYTERRHLLTRMALAAGVAILAAGCQTVGERGGRVSDSEALAARAVANAEYVDAAAIYERLAATATGDRARQLALEAALAWLDAGDATRARAATAAFVAPESGSNDAASWLLVVAGLAATENDWETADETLSALASQPLTTGQRLRYQRWRSLALFAAGDPALATSFLTQRELWLTSERAVAENHQLIWDGLRRADVEALYDALAGTSDATVRGWLELVVTTSPVRGNAAALTTVVSAWSQRYPGHPANATFVPALVGDGLSPGGIPRQVALLLPLSGRSQPFAAAVRDGFLAAHIADLGTKPAAPRIRVYDVTPEGASATMRRALGDGADLIVGPLTKTAVAELALQPALPVTTLALNRLPADIVPPGGLYQFALAPEDEARAAARRAASLGLMRAVALVPFGDLGDRVLASFAEEYGTRGGALLDVERFESSETDFSAEIRRILQIQASISRRRQLQSLLGERIEYEPRRRQDIDVIFLPAAAPTARLLKPQLTFHYAGDIPTFATARIANDDGRDSRELAGIEYAEIPWLVGSSDIQPTAEQMDSHWRSEVQIRRLHALGMDAYRLLVPLTSVAPVTVTGASGELTIGPTGIVRRQLVWSRFDGERGVALPQIELPPLEPDELSWPTREDRIGSD